MKWSIFTLTSSRNRTLDVENSDALKPGRNLSLGEETANNYANIRPKFRIVRRNDRYLCYHSSETAHCAEKPPLCPLKSGRNLVLDEETKDFYANRVNAHSVSDRIGVLRDQPNIYRVFFLPFQPNRSFTEYFLWKFWPNRSRRIWTKIRLITEYIRIIRNIFTSSLIKNYL